MRSRTDVQTPLLDVCVKAVPGEWVERAACRDADPDVFFPARGESATAARAICEGCPVIPECRRYVDRLEVGHYAWGFYAGESPRERQRRRATVR